MTHGHPLLDGAASVVRRVRSSVRRGTSPPHPGPATDPAAAGAERHPRLVAAAELAGWDPSQAEVDLLEEVDRLVAQGARPPRVAVLADATSRDWAQLLAVAYPRARVAVVDLSDPEERRGVHARLATIGRLHVIVDDTSALTRSTGHAAVPSDVFPHLRPGGALLVRLPAVREESPHLSEDLGTWAAVHALACGGAPFDVHRAAGDQRALEGAVASIAVHRGHLTVVNRVRAVAKMREHEMNVVLSQRGVPGGAVLASLPPQRFPSRCVLRESVATRDPRMPEVYDVPAMFLRSYDDVTCVPRQVAVQRNLLLPDTFRHNAAPRLASDSLTDVGPYFSEAPKRLQGAEQLRGAYFYLDSEWAPHFGHALTEQMSRLWAVAAAREQFPDLKAIMSRRTQGAGLAEYERDIFGAVGFAESDVVLHHQPVKVERLVAASPMFSMPRHIHPDLADLWRDIGERLASRSSGAAHPRRIFCSRRGSRRECLNPAEVEGLFAAQGFAVVHPEEMPFVEQVSMFRGAEVIAGFAGSALLTAAFCPTPRRVIVLGPSSYQGRNEYMLCAVVGHELDYVWSEPEPAAPGVRARAAPFSFDVRREGAFLSEVFSSL